MAVYVCDPSIDPAEEDTLEDYIKKYCPDYTYEELDRDHEITEYEGASDKAPPLFRIALEYTVDEHGLTARVPANGIRYDDTAYILRYIDILPYMGAIDSYNEGYTFIPDGSGALSAAPTITTEPKTIRTVRIADINLTDFFISLSPILSVYIRNDTSTTMLEMKLTIWPTRLEKSTATKMMNAIATIENIVVRRFLPSE